VERSVESMENVPPPSEPPAQTTWPLVSADGYWLWDGRAWIPRELSAGYGSARGTAKVSVGLLVAWIGSAVLLLAAEITRISVVSEFLNGNEVSVGDAQNSDNFVRLAGVANLGLLVLTAIPFLMWLHRIVANNAALGRAGRFTPGWSVGWWFIPFANLVRPGQVVAEAWRASEPSAREATTGSFRGGGMIFVWVWWVLYVTGNLIARIGSISSQGGSLERLRSRAEIEVASLVVLLVAAVLAITVVQRLTARQEATAARILARR
jgi:hypothetical protein